MAWQKNGTPDTLTGAGDVAQITDLTAKKFNQLLFHAKTSGTTLSNMTLNNNTNSVYAVRRQTNGTEATQIDQSNVPQFTIQSGSGIGYFTMMDFVSIGGEEKLGIGHGIDAGALGSGDSTNRIEHQFKFVPSPDADVTREDVTNTQTGDLETDTNLSALGTD